MDSSKSAYFERMGERRTHIAPRTASLEPLVLTDMFTIPRAGTLDITVTARTFPTTGSALPPFDLTSNTIHVQVLPRSGRST
jgi:hypothetical protein